MYIQTTVAHDVQLDRTQTKEVGTYIGAVHKRRQFKGGGYTRQNTYLVLKVTTKDENGMEKGG